MELNRIARLYRFFCSGIGNTWSVLGRVDSHAIGETDGVVVTSGTEAAALIPTDYLAYCRLPREKCKIFEWLASRKVKHIEEEMPPASFYEVLENSDLELHTAIDGKLMVSVSCQTLDMQLYGGNMREYLSPIVSHRRRSRSGPPRSPWSLLGIIILVISFMHSAFVVFRSICHIAHQQGLDPITEALEVPAQSISGYLWSQLSNSVWAVARVLRIV